MEDSSKEVPCITDEKRQKIAEDIVALFKQIESSPPGEEAQSVIDARRRAEAGIARKNISW